LLHGPASQDKQVMNQLAQWRSLFGNVQMVLVRGNHDDRSGDPPASCGVDCVDPGVALDEQQLLSGYHEPDFLSPHFHVAGHQHPAYRLKTRTESLRLPCFYTRNQCLVLPAFGEFTGGWTITADEADRVFVTDRQAVFAVPGF
jgi:uncharacterized protein